MAGNPVRDFAGTDAGEWVTSNGDFAVVAGAAAVPQGIRVRVRMFLGECYLDETAGIDWVGQILVKNPDPLVVTALIGTQIAKTPDVVSVAASKLTLSPQREAVVNYNVDSIYSQSPFAGQITVP